MISALAFRYISGMRILVSIVRICKWPLLIISILAITCLVLGIISNDTVLIHVVLLLLTHTLVGCLASYWVHEAAHAYVMRLFKSIEDVYLTAGAFRLSLTPTGSLLGWQVAVIALAGPCAAAAVGGVLKLILDDSALYLWYLLHLLFLLPMFGDGKSLIIGLRAWSTPISLRPSSMPTKLG